jgi:hypothetical protein
MLGERRNSVAGRSSMSPKLRIISILLHQRRARCECIAPHRARRAHALNAPTIGLDPAYNPP